MTLGFHYAVHVSDHLSQLFPPSPSPAPPSLPGRLHQPQIERLVSYLCWFPSGTREVLHLFNQEKYLTEKQSWEQINLSG